MERRARRAAWRGLNFESLESRNLLSALTPDAVRSVYGFDDTSLTGAGQTIAVIDAFAAPTLPADLDTFDQSTSAQTVGPSLFDQFGPASSFLTEHAMSSRERVDAGWAQETALDVEWAHAIAPGANILLVQATADTTTALINAVDWARKQTGVSVVSMSWGGGEFRAEKTLDSAFTTPAGHTPITFVAASGDAGGAPSYPAMSPNVLSVGGTTLRVRGDEYLSETAWSGSGGGISKFEPAAEGQAAVTGNSHRAGPDVSYDANPMTGFEVLDSLTFQGDSGWQTFGGTSAGTPQWAGLIALADQGRAAAGEATLDGPTQTIPAIYAAPSSDFHDVQAGRINRAIRALAGFDLATGRGSPVANLLINDLVAFA